MLTTTKAIAKANYIYSSARKLAYIDALASGSLYRAVYIFTCLSVFDSAATTDAVDGQPNHYSMAIAYHKVLTY